MLKPAKVNVPLNARKVTSDPDDVISEIKDKSVTVVDVRRPEEYKTSHIHCSKPATLQSTFSITRVAKQVLWESQHTLSYMMISPSDS